LILAVNPTEITTGLAFVCFLVSVVIIGGATWAVVHHATPDWLVSHVGRVDYDSATLIGALGEHAPNTRPC
jgi:hypothetical protein